MKSLNCLVSTGIALFAVNSFAGTMGPISPPPPDYLPWSIIASAGYGEYHTDRNTGIGRLAIAREMAQGPWYSLGIEVGVEQTWKKSFKRLFYYSSIPVQVNPMIDILFTGKINPWTYKRVFAQGKLGVVYRNWELRFPVYNQVNHSDLGVEGQIGLGFAVNNILSLSISYQGIARSDFTETNQYENLSHHLPYLNAALFGVALAF